LPTPAPGDVLRELMLAKRVTQGELSSLLGTPQTNISALISGNRKLNADQVALLCEYFHVGTEIFGDVKKARFQISKKVTNRTANLPLSQRVPTTWYELWGVVGCWGLLPKRLLKLRQWMWDGLKWKKSKFKVLFRVEISWVTLKNLSSTSLWAQLLTVNVTLHFLIYWVFEPLWSMRLT
jgi:plasmid maintenance system antidote protein VapI